MGRTNQKKYNNKIRDRRDACQWIKETSDIAAHLPPNRSISFDVCGTGDRCPNICQAKLGLHFRGDTLSANRISDYFSVGTVPVVTLHKQYQTFPSFIDYSQLTYFASMDGRNKTAFLSALVLALSNETDLKQKQLNVIENQKLFDWLSGTPFDVYMYQFQARIYESTRVNISRYSSLIL